MPKPLTLDGGFDVDIIFAEIQDELPEQIGGFVLQCFARAS